MTWGRNDVTAYKDSEQTGYESVAPSIHPPFRIGVELPLEEFGIK